MKAIDIVKYMIDNDLAEGELAEIAVRCLEYVPDQELLREIDERAFADCE